ncbi:probable G-protein coupled receptor Mth-like 11 [Drosophila innubila]|uniref:probable G-protein coupled receptor Mth-like 11 n=1 Tax=Drosophila innubila TaxID=198719 RepID=UPI00148BB1B0|nr:probable G-protein coupled receptor Mth-like 11 [Drosophila innubila]
MRNLFFSFVILSVIIADILGDIPGCDYFDTVALSINQRLQNGSYQYEGVLIPKEEVGEYDYEILFDGDKESVAMHTRGCICKFRTCIRFCCHPQKLLVDGDRSCENVNNTLEYSTVLNITLNNGTQIEKNVMEFMVQQHLPVPCANHDYLNNTNIYQNWTLFENATLLRHLDGRELSKRDYCFQPMDMGDYGIQLIPHHCLETDLTTSYIQMVSIFFIILIIIVYMILPNFKGVHGKCCKCYFVCLILSFTHIISASYGWVDTTDNMLCPLMAHTGYYSIIATFLWLLIINYNLWKTFNNIGVGQKSRFFHYNIFVWSAAAVLLLITSLVDFIFKEYSEAENWIPGFGTYFCWINVYSWSAMIYYYGPMSMLLIFNTTFFVKTAMRIFVQNRKNRRQLKKSEGQRNLRNLTNFSMFFRLFVIVGALWILEIASFIYARISTNSTGILFADIITSGQGVILFAVTILKRDVLKSLADRILRRKSQNEASISCSSHLATTEISLMSKAPKTLTNETEEGKCSLY